MPKKEYRELRSHFPVCIHYNYSNPNGILW